MQHIHLFHPEQLRKLPLKIGKFLKQGIWDVELASPEVKIDSYISNCQIMLGNKCFPIDLHVMQLESFDIILGME